MISGDRVIAHSVISVRCSSAVNFVSRSPSARRPSGSMSGSGQAPGRRHGFQFSSRVNWASSIFQSSQKSSEMRHICAYWRTCSPRITGVSPGDRLSTIGRFVRTIARCAASISGACAS